MASKSSGLNLKHMAGNLDSKCVPSGRVRRRTFANVKPKPFFLRDGPKDYSRGNFRFRSTQTVWPPNMPNTRSFPVGAIRACRSRLFGWDDAIGRHCFGRTRVCADPKVTMASKSSGLNLKHMAGNLDSKCVPSGRVPSPDQSPPRCRHADVRTARSSRARRARRARVDARRERRSSTPLSPPRTPLTRRFPSFRPVGAPQGDRDRHEGVRGLLQGGG